MEATGHALALAERFGLRGKTAVVTGGGRGLGAAIAEGLAEAGVSTLVLASRRVENLEATAARIRERWGTRTLAMPLDLAADASVEAFVRAVTEAVGPTDVLVNNSGRTWGADPEAIPLERWREVLEVNVTGTWRLAAAFGRRMVERRAGSIVNIASVAGLKGSPSAVLNALGYSTSKAAVIGMTRDLAVKWAPFGVRVNAIAPGFFPTRMTAALLDDPEHRRAIAARIPMGRVGEADDIKGLAIFLASDASRYVTGQVIAVDGGQTAM